MPPSLSQLPVSPKVASVLDSQGYSSLWPTQEKAIPLALSGKNLVLAVPTASGKSLVAYVALAERALRGMRGVYIVPLRALAREKYDDLKAFESAGIRVVMSTGDLDSEDPRLRSFDVLVTTSEKLDALLRHRAPWISEIGTVVADEVHLINDPDRGPTLEVLLARLRTLNPSAQFIALSATIRNSSEIAEWLGAEHVQSDWRPVELKEGILYGKAVRFLDGSVREVEAEADAVGSLVADSVKGGGQCLVFVNTRKSTESAAERLRPVVARLLSPEEAEALGQLAKTRGDEEPSSIEGRIARCVTSGVAFHHAGLTNDQRTRIEAAFKKGLLKAIVATPTLAAGINLPARRVVIRDLWRYDQAEGNAPIPVLEYKQMAGRAGRPRYDTVGEAVCIARSWDDRDRILTEYLTAEPEEIRSKVGSEAALRVHALASVAMGFAADEQALLGFFGKTFLAQQQSSWALEAGVRHVLDFLRHEGFLEADGREAAGGAVEHERSERSTSGPGLKATPFGRRTSELYIDPLSAVALRDALKRAERDVIPFGVLHAVCRCPDMRTLYLRRGDDWLEAEAVEREKQLLVEMPTGSDFEWFLGEVKTALLLENWIDEAPVEAIERRFDVYPGDVHAKVETAEWLAYAMRELAAIFNPGAARAVDEVHVRVKHGVKRELLPLIRLSGVGRVRARALHASGFKTLADLRAAPLEALTRVRGIGPALARGIHRELGVATSGAGQSPGGGDP